MKRLKRSRGSLTLRSFLLTFALTALACAVTYAAIACLTPISYSSLLEEELMNRSASLAAALEGRAAADCVPVLEAFSRDTGAYLRLIGGAGEVLYDSLPHADSFAWEGDGSPEYAGVAISGYAVEEGDAVATQYEGEVTYAEQVSDFQICETIALADGELGELVVVGGMRAVNHAVEAMKRLMPYLLIVILGISLLGALVYSRLITRPIVALSRIARRMAAQDFDVRWQRKRRDEIGVLGDSLNLLSENLSGALEQLRQANLALQGDIDRERELDRQRTAFFAAASHELKTPVTILKGQLSGMLAQVGVYRDREKYLARALEVTSRMEGLIREILTISRIGSGGYALKREKVDLSALMEEVLCQNGELIEQRELRLARDIAPDVTVMGSASLLSNALDNVLMNAILYSPEGATLRVRVSAGELCVINGGASIPEAQLAHLFEPFYRVEQSRSRASGGSGLGLYLVRCILELHGASCGLENSAEGVRFTARFSDGS